MQKRKMRPADIIGWMSFGVFALIAIITNWHDQMLDFSGAVGAAKLVLIAVWLGFLAYSLHCTRHESLFSTTRKINGFFWGRQIIIDLYISAFLSIGLVFLVTGSLLQTLLWSIAIIPFVNQAILLFIILYLDRIVEMLATGYVPA